MIVDAETLELSNSIEAMLDSLPQAEGQVKPELMESVLEIATQPCKNTREAGAQLRDLRRLTQRTAAEKGLAIGSAGTSSSNRNLRSCSWSQSESRFRRSSWRAFISRSPSGL